MELTKREKELLIIYKAFYGKNFDPLDIDATDNFQNMYCILETIPADFGTEVVHLGDFVFDPKGVYSSKLDDELTLISQASEEVRDFNNSIKIDYFMPVTASALRPDVDLSSDQGIISNYDYALFARACLFAKYGVSSKELENFLDNDEFVIKDEIRGSRNIRLNDYIISILRSYGVVKDYSNLKEMDGSFKEDLDSLSSKEKEVLRNYYLFYGKYYDPKEANHLDNALNAYCILQMIPSSVGCLVDNYYPFRKSNIIDSVESIELEKVLKGLDSKSKDIIEYYNNVSMDKIPFSKTLLEKKIVSTDMIGRVANTCLYIYNNPEKTCDEVLEYLYDLDIDDGYLNNTDDNINKVIVNILERYGIIKHRLGEVHTDSKDNDKKKNEGLVKRLVKIFGGQK